MSTIIEALKTYIATYPYLKANAPLSVNFLGIDPTEYSINPLPGETVLERNLDNSSVRVYPFALTSMESTADDLERIATSGFYETLSDWFESQTNAETLPTLPTGKTARRLEAIGAGYLFQEGSSGTGVYQIQCKLTYEQDPL
jgi:hypothetical protein